MTIQTSSVHIRRLLLISGVLLVPMLSGCASSADDSCVASMVKVSSSPVHAGESLTLSGDYFFAQCLDQGDGISGPATKLPIVFSSVDDPSFSKQLAVVDADSKGHLETKLTIPEDAKVGTAKIQVGDDTNVVVEVTAS